MSMEKVKQTCVKVFGEDGQTRIVNVHTASEAKAIMAKVLHKFGIDETSADSYCIFVGSSTNGEARALSDQELVDICRSADRPEKERLILRKRHMYPTHEEFKRKGTINANRRLQQKDDKQPSSPLYNNNSNNSSGWSQQQSSPSASSSTLNLSHRASHVGSFRSQNNTTASNSSTRGRRRFFGERPPSEIISSNLQSFFPNHNREILETAGIKAQRLSMTRRNSSLSRMEPRNYRNSVLPELVSVLGVDLDKFLEEEEEDDEDDEFESSSLSSITSDDDSDDDEEDGQPSVGIIKPINDTTPTITTTTTTTTTTTEEEKDKDKKEGETAVEEPIVTPPTPDVATAPSPPSSTITTPSTAHTLINNDNINQRRSSSLFYLNEYKSFKPTIENSK